MRTEPKISDLFARLILAARRGDIMEMNDMPELPDGEYESRAAIIAALHAGMFTRIEPSGSKVNGFALNPHPLFWMGPNLFRLNDEAMTWDERLRLVNDATALMEAGINPMPYPVTTFGVLHRTEHKLHVGSISGGQVLFARCMTVKRGDSLRPDQVLPPEVGDEAIGIDLFIGHLKRVYGPHNADPHGWRYCNARAHLSIGVAPMMMRTMVHADDHVTESGRQHAKAEIEEMALVVMASLALLSQQRSIVQSDLEPPSYSLRNAISNRLNPLPKMVRVDLSAYQYQYPFDHAAYPTGRQQTPHDRRGHVRHLADGRKVQVRAAKIRGGAAEPRTYVIGRQDQNQWPDRQPCASLSPAVEG